MSKLVSSIVSNLGALGLESIGTIFSIAATMATSLSCAGIASQSSTHIIERNGKFHRAKRAEGYAKWPYFDRVVAKVDMRETSDTFSFYVTSKDGVYYKISGHTFFVINDAVKAHYTLKDESYQILAIAEYRIKTALGKRRHDYPDKHPEQAERLILKVTNQLTEPRGYKVTAIQFDSVDLGATMNQATSERAAAEIVGDAEGRRVSAQIARVTAAIVQAEDQFREKGWNPNAARKAAKQVGMQVAVMRSMGATLVNRDDMGGRDSTHSAAPTTDTDTLPVLPANSNTASGEGLSLAAN